MTRTLGTYGTFFIPLTAVFTWKFLIETEWEKVNALKDPRKK